MAIEIDRILKFPVGAVLFYEMGQQESLTDESALCQREQHSRFRLYDSWRDSGDVPLPFLNNETDTNSSGFK
jgi:hypothetical protein